MAGPRGKQKGKKPGKPSKTTKNSPVVDKKTVVETTKRKREASPAPKKVVRQSSTPKKQRVKPVQVHVHVEPDEDDEDHEHLSTVTHVSSTHSASSLASLDIDNPNDIVQDYTSESPRGPTPPPRNRHEEDEDAYIEFESGRYSSHSYGTPSRSFWSHPSTEIELCRLWEEEVNLYDLTHPDHRNPAARNASMDRISGIMKISVNAVNTRMNTLRTAYQKAVNTYVASGSSPQGKTARVRDIMRLCYFLKPHVKTCASLSTYQGSTYTGRTTIKPECIKTKGYVAEQRKQQHPHQRYDDRELIATGTKYQRQAIHTVVTLSSEEDDLQSKSVPVSGRTRMACSPKADEVKPAGSHETVKYKKGPFSKNSATQSSVKPSTSEARKSLDMTDTDQTVKKNPNVAHVSKTHVSSHQRAFSSRYVPPSVLDDTVHEKDDFDDNKGDWYSTQSTVRRKTSTKDAGLINIMQERSKVMEKMTDNMAVMSQHVQAATQKEPQESADSLWAKSLVMQMSRMSQEVKDQFMVHVYKLAIDAISGKFP